MRPFTQHFCSNYTSQFTLVGASVRSVEEKVRQIIMDQLGLEASEVKLHTSFVDDLGADSRDLMEVVMRLEESFALETRMGKRKRSGLCRTRWITFRGMQSRFSSDSGLG